ncbi:MAG: hypothetical protein CBB92_04915 [Flammeovirgaceae bacterium TMED32]|nr:RNA polymerase subunit sigma [Gammaproteobacteria bacterium]OUT99855.1 MAG: hypothetical protein CBB92_04915 [Flammeovirgaceae bacterium TMED32]RPG27040.1 MAG: sigma-70 family RNA polymerase sigma factor [Gammaproteobacteria bacterium TMED50]
MTSALTVKNPTDIEYETELLLAVSREKSRKAYAELYEIMMPRMRGFLIRQGRPGDESDNVSQDTMLSVWRKASMFNPEKSSARTWMFAIMRNRLIDVQRSQARDLAGRDRYRHTSGVEEVSDGGLDSASNRSRLARLLSGLSEEHSKVLIMSYIEGKSHREICEELELPLGTVKSRIRIALAHVQNHVQNAEEHQTR